MTDIAKPLGEADVRHALEEVLTVAFAGPVALLSHPNLTLELRTSTTTGLCVAAVDAAGAEHIRCHVAVSVRKVPSLLGGPPVDRPWREGTWGPQLITDARGRQTGLIYAATPVGGDIVQSPDGSGEEYRVVRAITALNPVEVTVVSILDETKTFTFPVDGATSVRFRRSEMGRATEMLLSALPGTEVAS